MDTIVIILIIILLIVAGIFLGFQMNKGDSSSATGYNSYPSQYGGGGCGWK